MVSAAASVMVNATGPNAADPLSYTTGARGDLERAGRGARGAGRGVGVGFGGGGGGGEGPGARISPGLLLILCVCVFVGPSVFVHAFFGGGGSS